MSVEISPRITIKAGISADNGIYFFVDGICLGVHIAEEAGGGWVVEGMAGRKKFLDDRNAVRYVVGLLDALSRRYADETAVQCGRMRLKKGGEEGGDVLYEGEKEVARLEKLNGGWGVFFCGKSGIPLKEQEKERLAGGMEYDEAVGMLFKTIMEKRVIDRLVKSWFDGGKAACGVELSGIDALINRLGR